MTLNSKALQISEVEPEANSQFPRQAAFEPFQPLWKRIKAVLSDEITQWARQKAPYADPRTAYAEAMSALCEDRITKPMINGWCSESRNEYHPPTDVINKHVVLTGSKACLDLAAEGTAFAVFSREETLDAEYGRLQRQRQEIEWQLKAIEAKRKEGR